MGQGKTVGLVLIVVALLIVAVAAMFLVSGVAEGRLKSSGFLLGIGLVLILALPLLGVGTLMIVRGRGEDQQFAEVEKEKKILNIVLTHGQVNVGEVAVGMNLTR